MVPYDRLTQDQLRAVTATPSESRIVRGGPGSGKTLVIAHRARYLMDQYADFRERVRIFVFTRTLKAYIRSGLRDLGIDEHLVETFDHWCIDQYREHIGYQLPQKDRDTDYERVRAEVAQVARAGQLGNRFAAALVDEGQDLDLTAYDILGSAANHVTVSFDANQRLYERGANLEDIARALHVRSQGIAFINTFRCSPYIARVAAAFISSDEHRTAFLNQVTTEQTEKEKPLVYFARDLDDEKRRLAAVIRDRQKTDRSIAILLPQKKQVFGFHKGLAELGVETEVQSSGRQHSDHEVNFASDLPKLMTYHSAKGLTFETVLLPRLSRNSFSRLLDGHRKLLFVGVTRATKWLYVGTDDDGALPAFDIFRELHARGDVHFEQSGGRPQKRGTARKKAQTDDLIDFF